MATKPDNPPLVVIVGETASGKSALAFELAKRFDGEIINADSWAVYRDFNIGTAKPSTEERRAIPHHLLDVADPTVGFSAAVFQRLANEAIEDIVSRGKLPILVGGTGLYVDSVIFDYSFLPPSEPELRRQLNALSVPELLEYAGGLKLDTSSIDIRNKRRIIRLIENNGQLPTKGILRSSTVILGVSVQREVLQERVEARVNAMLAAGLEEEVRSLAQTYGWEVEPMKGIGYREWREYFAGSQTLEETKRRIIKSTMDLAKRQRTWFKRNKSIQWVTEQVNAVAIVTTLLNK